MQENQWGPWQVPVDLRRQARRRPKETSAWELPPSALRSFGRPCDRGLRWPIAPVPERRRFTHGSHRSAWSWRADSNPRSQGRPRDESVGTKSGATQSLRLWGGTLLQVTRGLPQRPPPAEIAQDHKAGAVQTQDPIRLREFPAAAYRVIGGWEAQPSLLDRRPNPRLPRALGQLEAGRRSFPQLHQNCPPFLECQG